MKTETYRDVFKKLITNKVLILCVIATTVLSFGFTITNPSIGLDDPASYHYLQTDHYGSMIQQGRLLHVAYNMLTGAMEFLPFFNEFVGAALLALSALLFCTLFQHTARGRLSTLVMAVFCCLYISYPLINEKFIYSLDVVVTTSSYCTCALALMYTERIAESKWNFVKAVALEMLSIACYESFGFVFFCGVFALFILRVIVNREDLRAKTLFSDGMKAAAVLLTAFVLYYGLVIGIQLVTDQYGVFERTNAWSNATVGVFENLKNITLSIINRLFRTPSYSFVIFSIASVAGAVLCGVLSVRRRNPWLLPCYVGLYVGNLFIHYICGYVIYRAAQTFCLFVAFVIMMLAFELTKVKRLKKAVALTAALLVFIQAAEMTRWFYNDHIRYQKEAFAANAIATRLLAECDVTKPIVFTDNGEGMEGYAQTNYYPYSQINGYSVLYWGDRAFDEHDAPNLIEFFRMHGYDFMVKPTAEQAAKALEESKNMPAWPAEDSIVETDEYIIVNVR